MVRFQLQILRIARLCGNSEESMDYRTNYVARPDSDSTSSNYTRLYVRRFSTSNFNLLTEINSRPYVRNILEFRCSTCDTFPCIAGKQCRQRRYEFIHTLPHSSVQVGNFTDKTCVSHSPCNKTNLLYSATMGIPIIPQCMD